jgi:hypothetical protein
MTTTHPRSAHHMTGPEAVATGLSAFSAVMLFLVGLLDLFRGIMAVSHNQVFVTTPNYTFKFDLTSWGWIHLVLGALAMVVSVGILQSRTWARITGVAVAGLVIIANFLSLPYHPLWSVIMIALSGFVIWALCLARGQSIDTR